MDTIGIVGGGFMGSGIAESAARAGLDVRLHEPWQERIDASRAAVEKSMARATQRGKLTSEEAEAMVGRIAWTPEMGDLADCDIVVEAVSEVPELKSEIFSKLDDLCEDKTILASNTSSIPIAQLAAATDRTDRVAGLHFFSPVPVMALVEVVVALDTSDSTRDACCAVAEKMGKTPILTKDRSGFVVNMLLIPYLMAGVRMYEDGFASREDIDTGMKLGCAHPMGPLELADFIGLDILWSISRSLHEEFARAEYAPPPLLKRMVAAGRLGRKTGRGFYDYG